MKSLLIYSYSAKNAGDMAITVGALDHLTKIYYKCYSISRYSSGQQNFKDSSKYLLKRYSNLEMEPSPFHLDRTGGTFNILKDYFIGFLKICFFSNSIFSKQIEEVDHVYFNGGNLLRCNSISDLIRLFALLSPLKVAIKKNKKIIILPHSTAETNLIGRFIMRRVLNKVNVIYAREELSYNKFKLMYPKANVKLNTDMAFFINSELSKSTNNIIAFTTRSQTMGDLGEFDKETKAKITRNLKLCVDFSFKMDYKVVFVVQTKKDLEFTKKLYEDYKGNLNVSFIENYDPVELIKFYSSCKLLIGMRLHSLILALNSGTPVLGYFDTQWGLKNPGLLKVYNQKFSYVDNDKEEPLIKLLENFNFEKSDDLSLEIINIKNKYKNKLKL